MLTEKLEWEYYTTAGSFKHGRVTSRTPAGETDDITNAWTAPDEPEEPSAVVWLVSRDDRGGCAWLRRVIALE